MHTKIFLSFFFFCWIYNPLNAQNDSLRFIGVEAGIDLMQAELKSFDFIRKDIPTSTYLESDLKGYYQSFYGGVKIELYAQSNRWSILSGLRYTQIDASLGKSSLNEIPDDYFYLMLEEDDQITHYVRVHSIDESIKYLGIPVETRYFFNRARFVKFYAKASVDFNFKVEDKMNVNFHNEDAREFTDQVIDRFSERKFFLSTFRLMGGIKFGSISSINLSLEFAAPTLYLFNYSTALVESYPAGGFQVNLQYPF